MNKFIKDYGLLKGKGESDIEWITTDNGVHVPIKPGQTKQDAIQEKFDSRSNQSTIRQVRKEINKIFPHMAIQLYIFSGNIG